MKRMLLTGASEGLGAALGRLCSEHGVEVVALCRTMPDYPCQHLKVDLAEPASIERAAERIRHDFADFDALVNCAGVLSVEPPDAISYTALEKTMAVNLLAPIYLTSQLFSLIKDNGADVVNVGSTAGTKGYADQCAYGASKWGVRGTSQNLTVELKGTPCRVIQFNPGGFKSNLFSKALGKDVDLPGFMDPADLAKLLYFILTLPKSVEVSEILVNRK